MFPDSGTRHNLAARIVLPVVILLLALLQPALLPLAAGGDLELAPFFRVDSLSIVFGVVSMLALAAVVAPLSGQPDGHRIAPSLVLVAVALLLYAYAHNMFVLAVGWLLLGVGILAVLRFIGQPPAISRWLVFSLALPPVLLLTVAFFPAQTGFAPPSGGVADPWHPIVVVAVALACLVSTGSSYLYRPGRAGDRDSGNACASLISLYSLAAPFVLARMLVAAPWHPVGSWLLVLFGMLAVLSGAYMAYALPPARSASAFVAMSVGVALTGFGIATASPLGAAGATWVLLVGLPWAAVRGWRWVAAGALLALLPGLWMVSQAALETGYGVVAALLLPVWGLVSLLVASRSSGATYPRHWSGVVLVAIIAVAVIAPQAALETSIRPVVRALAGGVGALTTPGIDWGVGMLVRSPQGTVPAALPATGIAIAVFLAAVVLYWLKQIAGRALERSRGEAENR